MRSVIGKFAFTCAVVASACVAAVSSAGIIVENGPATNTSYRIGGTNSQVEVVVWQRFLQEKKLVAVAAVVVLEVVAVAVVVVAVAVAVVVVGMV